MAKLKESLEKKNYAKMIQRFRALLGKTRDRESKRLRTSIMETTNERTGKLRFISKQFELMS